jgi:UDP-N-acetylglucosamine 2-epimerase (non-hydrolysing)
MKKRIAFVTGSRADYGIMRRYLGLLNKDEDIELSILTTGALLDNRFGHQVDLIYADGFNVSAELQLPIDTTSDLATIHTMSVAQDKFAEYFDNNIVDLLLILGDRYEMLSVAIAASMKKIPILHIHGGEATFANYDEFIRHAITKMSLYHFTATEEYRRRVIQLGESPERVFYVGALGAENCLYIDEENVSDEIKSLEPKSYFVVLFHPETLTNVDVAEQIKAVLDSCDKYNDYNYVFLGSNADTNSHIIRKMVKEYVDSHDNTFYYENLHTDGYHYLLKNSICLIGNSSSGIIEAPSLGIYTINIGDRQDGRVRGNSVLDVECTFASISLAMEKVLELYKTVEPINPYYKENSAELYYSTTKELLKRIDVDIQKPKVFYDIDFEDKI